MVKYKLLVEMVPMIHTSVVEDQGDVLLSTLLITRHTQDHLIPMEGKEGEEKIQMEVQEPCSFITLVWSLFLSWNMFCFQFVYIYVPILLQNHMCRHL